MRRFSNPIGIGRRTLLLGLAASAAGPVRAQGFAGLASPADGFALPDPAYRLTFPADHGPHPAFRTEWWYLTATLTDAKGRECGLQWTLFRSALRPDVTEGWDSPQVWMAHAALTSADTHVYAERFARGGIGQAGVTADPFDAWIDDWSMTGAPGTGLDTLTVTARGAEFAYDIALTADGPLVLQGQQGFSQKAPDGRASHYYSQPAYAAEGTVTFPGEDPVAVTGRGWLDREWSSAPMADGQRGWDWFALNFLDGTQMMAARMRSETAPYTAATWIDAEGRATPYPDGAVTFEPLATTQVAGQTVPTRWRVTLPARGTDVTVDALNPGAWMGTAFPYWEGPVTLTDTATGELAGRGYLEMTGYGEPG
ncbi:lipocalin-like domain-containing protein [Chachezhania antarctica]|uniref:lipocalin-like domain-containing protein n=1 Tax=Chachezhania antarctica TaxID=2340860 RepID=UPI000EB23920|nr:lipocalin-like domain-containing protein [Chachezhania antarctica]